MHNEHRSERTPNSPRGLARLLAPRALALGLAAGVGVVVAVSAACLPIDNYGSPCGGNGDCTGEGVSCFSTPREGAGEMRCLTRAPGQDDDPCLSYLECAEGRCEPTTSLCSNEALPGLPECDSDNDCDEDEICVGERCESARTCADDIQCGAGEVCVDRRCIDGERCDNDDQCSAPDTCVEDLCQPECVTAADCGADALCAEGSCEAIVRCATFDDCAADEACIDLICGDAECAGDEDCVGEEMCADRLCFNPNSECAIDDDCGQAGVICIDDACVEGFVVVALVSEASVPDDIDGAAPGPDMDAVSLVLAGDVLVHADRVVAEVPGAATAENLFDDPTEVLGAPDAYAGGGADCVMDTADRRFYSMGGGDSLGTPGVLVVGFGRVIPDGSSVRVIELDQDACPNVAAQRADQYQVYVGRDGATDPLDAQQSDLWQSVGRSGEFGGIVTLDVTY